MRSPLFVDDDALRAVILDLLASKTAGKTICPSEAARAIAGSDEQRWRRLMKPIRAVAVTMAQAGELEIRRKGKIVDPEKFRGVYRLARPVADSEPITGDIGDRADCANE